MNKVTEGLIKARSFLKEPKVLAKGVRKDENGGHCPLGLLDLAFGYDPENYGWPHECKQEYRLAILALAAAVPISYLVEAVEAWRGDNLPDEAQEIAPAALAVVTYGNEEGFQAVCRMFDHAITIRQMEESLALKLEDA